ncbi:hypothetical protein PIB30_038375 [Stylosanthes scabra]|uniref:Uncharacterized protein n=1 Tax=Stylosanthes scabra TaxID=79078 RepID=A0ABU6REN3_9FABA|nr:hypothetical protein [Stylosanthes scabra]
MWFTRNGFRTDRILLQICSGWIPSSSRSGSSSSKLTEPPTVPGPEYIGPDEVEAAAEPMSKDMNGMPEFGWKGGAAMRRCWMFWPPAAGFPACGKATGGTLNSLAIGLEFGGEIRVL